MSLSVLDMCAIACAGLAAGVLNTAAAGGALVSFLTMVGLGVPPLAANVANLVATPAAFVAAAVSTRPDVRSRPSRAGLIAAAAGTTSGVAMLRLMPTTAFVDITPWLVLCGAAMLAIHPTITAAGGDLRQFPPRTQAVLLFGCGTYAGMFGAGVGVVVLLSLLLTTTWSFIEANVAKNLICLATSAVGAIALTATGHVSFGLVALLAIPTAVGGLLGSFALTRIPGATLRWIVVVISATSAAIMLTLS